MTEAAPQTSDLHNWSSTLEDLLDDGDCEGAKRLLEGIVSKLESRSDAPMNLKLAAALNDLGTLYNSQGLTMKADSLFNLAVLIKLRAEKAASTADLRLGSCVVNHTDDENFFCRGEERAGELSTSGFNHGEDWEIMLCKDEVIPNGTLATSKILETSSHDNTSTVQRGRGAFTFGEMGLYSDKMIMPTSNDEDGHDATGDESEGANCQLNYGAGHVLVVDGFSPKATTKELEDLFEPFASHGVAIRWVNDTTALAVFRNPTVAREALQQTRDSQFRIRVFDADSCVYGLVNKKDLEPPVPRPATSAQAAQRMIVGALRKQGLRKMVQTKSNFQDLQKQEGERKQRLFTRQKLRDEAWGPES